LAIIELATCGAPVITSNKTDDEDEVGGKAALYMKIGRKCKFFFANQFQEKIRIKFWDEIIRLGYMKMQNDLILTRQLYNMLLQELICCC